MRRPLKWAIVLVVMPMNISVRHDASDGEYLLSYSGYRSRTPRYGRGSLAVLLGLPSRAQSHGGRAWTSAWGRSGSANLMRRQVEWWTHSTRKVLYLHGTRRGMAVSLLGERGTDQASAGTPGNGWARRVAKGRGLLRPQGHGYDPGPPTVETRVVEVQLRKGGRDVEIGSTVRRDGCESNVLLLKGSRWRGWWRQYVRRSRRSRGCSVCFVVIW